MSMWTYVRGLIELGVPGRQIMDFQQGYCLDIKTDRDVNDIIKWWNDILFERG